MPLQSAASWLLDQSDMKKAEHRWLAQARGTAAEEEEKTKDEEEQRLIRKKIVSSYAFVEEKSTRQNGPTIPWSERPGKQCMKEPESKVIYLPYPLCFSLAVFE
jgi:hypothetical protein